MAGYTPKFGGTDFVGGKNILASEHLQFIEAGATLDAEAIGAKVLEIGTLIGRDEATGKFVEYDEEAGLTNLGILNHSVEIDGVHDVVVGEVIVRGSVYEAKLPVEVPESFKTGNPLIRYVSHV